MTALPDEIWAGILDYVDPLDVVSSQRVSSQLLKLARDSSLWRNKVFERAPSATRSYVNSNDVLSSLTGALGGLSIGQSPLPQTGSDPSTVQSNSNKASQRAKAVREWDCSHHSEEIDWYSEYIARHATLSTIWAENGASQDEVRGMAPFNNFEKIIGPLDDGSLGIWDVQQSNSGRRSLVQLGKSRKGLLFEDTYTLAESSHSAQSKSFGIAVDNIAIDSKRMRAFVAVENILNEVDLEKMTVISQNKFAWSITALSQESGLDCPLTVGTSFSLHIHDPRLSYLKPASDDERLDPNDPSKIAFLQNYSKEATMSLDSGDHTERSRRRLHNRIETYARVEPGPQSILHQNENQIIIAGRMPSILFYDRRNFPKPRAGIHSGARLSAITTLPVPPTEMVPTSETSNDSTLIACGEYNGRGSLEVYSIPCCQSEDGDLLDSNQPTNYKDRVFISRNRQEASSSKLLSVATQGTRIVFADSEGMLKWVERDGRGLARRWNINNFAINERGGSITGDKVVRKMLAMPTEPSERGIRGDGDLLVWTGEKIGIVTTKPKGWGDHDLLVQAFERGMNLEGDDEEERHKQKEDQYSIMMRQALERQADERRWMSRFGVKRW